MDENHVPQNAAAAFQSVSSEFRVEILETLAQSDGPLSFTGLLDRLDEPDSGRLNYHLDQLRGRYISRVDDGYRLTIQGAKIISSIRASRYVDDDSTFSVAAPGNCQQCGSSPLRLEQSGQQAIIRCPACDSKQFRKSATAALWKHRPDEDVPAALDRIVWTDLELATSNVCADCHSRMLPRVVENTWEEDADLYGFYDFDVVAVFECELCTNWKFAPHGLLAWLHPDVRAFHREFGVDPDAVTCWQIEQAVDARYTTVVSTDPYEIEVRFPIDDVECRVTFNDSNEVRHVVREWDH